MKRTKKTVSRFPNDVELPTLNSEPSVDGTGSITQSRETNEKSPDVVEYSNLQDEKEDVNVFIHNSALPLLVIAFILHCFWLICNIGILYESFFLWREPSIFADDEPSYKKYDYLTNSWWITLKNVYGQTNREEFQLFTCHCFYIFS
eukprot:UN27769